MFYGQCWKCGERWELGTASSCKCPDEDPVKFAFRENNDSTEVFKDSFESIREKLWDEYRSGLDSPPDDSCEE